MTDVLETLKKLPLAAYSVLPSDPRQVIGISRGVPGYVPLGRHDTEQEARDVAAEMNKCFNVTDKQLEAMEAGSMFGWHVPGADPDSY